MEVVAGLQNASIFRLKKTWAQVRRRACAVARAAPRLGRRPRARCSCALQLPKKTLGDFEDLKKFVSQEGNYKTFRCAAVPLRERFQQRCSALLCSALPRFAARVGGSAFGAPALHAGVAPRGDAAFARTAGDSQIRKRYDRSRRHGTGPARRRARAAVWGRRDFIHSANPPCVPYLGVYLTDLTFIEDGIPDKIKHTTAAGGDGASADRIAPNQTKPNGRARERDSAASAHPLRGGAHMRGWTAQWRWSTSTSAGRSRT